MNILFAGKSDFNYNRVKVLRSGLEKFESVHLAYYSIPKRSSFDKNNFKIKADWADYIFIPPFRHKDVGFLKSYTNTPIIFDPLISKYLTKLDYGHFWKLPIKYFLDLIPFKKADILLTDTRSHRDYFIGKFKLNPQTVFPLYIGSDTNLFFPAEKAPKKDKLFKVGFYGSFVPLQGAEKIVRAAALLKDQTDISFEIIGGGYTFKKAKGIAQKEKLSNITFKGNIEYEKLNETINSFDICLGIFGDSLKADLVIPNKIYHYASIGKAIISRDTKGVRELFTDGLDILLCKSTPNAIANSILKLKADYELKEKLEKNAAALIKNEYNEIKIAQSFIDIIQKYEDYTKSKG
ncbi:glycosyltransferase [Marivirga sp.]|uniref:glycosyltransferase n=1 Tax=Marivirga sp. TaxID=2018662 RepID=UPI0025E64D99|nr:glycosyltransferase [Marivirga sp.]